MRPEFAHLCTFTRPAAPSARWAVFFTTVALVLACGAPAHATANARCPRGLSSVHALCIVDSAALGSDESPALAAVARRCSSLSLLTIASFTRVRQSRNLNVSRIGGLYGP